MQPGSATDLIIQFIPLMVIQVFVYGSIVFVMARKRGINPWPWAIGTVVPVVGLIVFAVFMLLTLLSMLDRLNALEKHSPFD